MKNKIDELYIDKKESFQDVLKVLVITLVLGVLFRTVFFRVIFFLVLKMNFL